MINTALYGGDAYLPANNLAYKYVATYTADVTEPDAATIHDITATAIYTLEALTVLIVISCVVVFLVFLKRRQMNKYEKY